MEISFNTPNRGNAFQNNWAYQFLNQNNQASRREKVDFVLSKAHELEEQAERMSKKIEIKNK